VSFPRYPEYKDSGVEWLRKVPAHWDLARFKHILRERDERSIGGEEELLSVSAYTGVTPRSAIIEAGAQLTRAETLEGYKVCKRNDLVVNIMLAWNRGLGVTVHDGIVSPSYCVFEPNSRVYPRFLDYLVRCDQYLPYFKAHSAGVIDSRLRLYPDVLAGLIAIMPPLNEQRAIVDVLDHETAKIDALVAEQERLIALLKEKRQAVISHAVTKGLNPDAPLQDSTSSWIGNVPAHWEYGPLKRFCKVVDCKHVTADFVDDGYPLVSIREVQSRWVFLESAKKTTEWFFHLLSEGGRRLVPGDLVFSRNATVGEVAQIAPGSTECAMGQDVVLIRCLPGVANPDFVQCVLRSLVVETQLGALMIGSTFKRVNVEEIRSLQIAMPPLHEAVVIADAIQRESDSIEHMIDAAYGVIRLLSERRNTLITAAVTGQIDVRDLAPSDAA
jgi:type I restriction enzyme S subunit